MNKTSEDRAEAKRFARLWTDSRTKSGKTQEFMAKGLGVSKRTIQNWENGVTSPDLLMCSEWFRILGLNPLPYFLAFLFPDLFDSIDNETEEAAIDAALNTLIKDAPLTEKKQLLYLMAGRHGSSWYALLQMFTAHCHTSLHSRANAARLIYDNYMMEEKTNYLVCTDNIKPDTALLKKSIENAMDSVGKHQIGYSNMGLERTVQKDLL